MHPAAAAAPALAAPGTGRPEADDPGDPLALFSSPVAGWFRERYGTPTPPQALGWPAIARGEHTLILSPTGSGKTLAAFLWSLDALFRELQQTPEPERPRSAAGTTRRRASTHTALGPQPSAAEPYEPGVRIVYISPLKALNNDIERNLQVPLADIRRFARRAGHDLPAIRVAVRTGDTPPSERERMQRRPPHVLITTPESLYLLLTSDRARAMFATTHTLIVDEIHTLAGSKRGAHLALSLERLERLGARRIQRIGLSATVRPLEEAARFLGGQDARTGFAPRPVAVVDASYARPLDLQVITPVEDFRKLPGNTVWSEIIPQVVRLIEQHHTTLIFCNNRRLAERTADRLNERRLLEKTGGEVLSHKNDLRRDTGMFAAGIDAARLEAAGLQPIRAHHGSMSKAARLEMEQALKAGTLPALVATSSLELGIDIGEVDLVIHLQSPKSVASGLQRIGRSGHLVGQTSIGRIFTTHVEDVMEAAAVAHGMLHGEIERTRVPENPLDILAQQILAMVSVEDWDFDALLALVRQSYPYRHLSEATFRAVVEMLAGKYPALSEVMGRGAAPAGLQARLSWDRVHNRLAALPGSRFFALQSAGTIPDRGAYTLVLSDRRTKIGELDEEFVFESRPGDTFLLGSQVWRIQEITDDRVIAVPAPGEIPRMPFWRGDFPWRAYDLGRRIGAFRRQLVELLAPLTPGQLEQLRHASDQELPKLLPQSLLSFLRQECALDRNSIVQIVDYVARQLAAAGQIATDRSIVVEVYDDALGDPRIVVHSPFGGRVNGPWGLVLASAIRERLGIEPQVVSGDDGIMLRFGDTLDPTRAAMSHPVALDLPSIARLITTITSAEAKERLLAELPGSAVFGAQFRMNAARALLLPRQRAGKRTPLWLTRLRAKDLLQAVQRYDDFPLLLETYRDCLRDVMDLDGLTEVLDQLERGELQVTIFEAEVPSPVAMGLDTRFALQYVYEYDAPRGEKQLAALSLNRALLAELLQDGTLAGLLKPQAIASVTARIARTGDEWRARSVEELAQLLYDLGDLTDEEIAARCAPAPLPHSTEQRMHASEAVGWPPEEETGSAVAASQSCGAWLRRLASNGRIVSLEIAGQRRWVHAERLAEYTNLAANPVPVLRRWLAHNGAATAAALAARYGLSEPDVRVCLASLSTEVVEGQLSPDTGRQWIDRRVLEQIHRRTLTLLRNEVRPAPLHVYSEFLQRWQRVAASSDGSGRDDTGSAIQLNQILQQLRGLALPAIAWERDVLPARLPGFALALLAERCQTGELMWVAGGGRDPKRARVCFFFRGEGGLFFERTPDVATLGALSPPARRVYDFLSQEGAALLADIVEGADLDRATVQAALAELVLAGLVTNDSLAALHAILGGEPPTVARPGLQSSLEAQLAARLGDPALRPGWPRAHTRHRLREARRRARELAYVRAIAATAPWTGGATDPSRGRPSSTLISWTGRWSLVHRPSLLGRRLDDAECALRQARLLLGRWGVVTKACLERELPVMRWDTLYPVLSSLEARGEVRRGYFVEGLPGIQFALPEVVEQLRATNAEPRGLLGDAGVPTGCATTGCAITVLNAVDPAQLFGGEAFAGALRVPRVATAAVAVARGEPVAVMVVAEDSSATVEALDAHPALVPALRALGQWWSPRVRGHLKVTRWHESPVLAEAAATGALALESAGYVRESGGLLWPG